jgi:hypothetical protein
MTHTQGDVYHPDVVVALVVVLLTLAPPPEVVVVVPPPPLSCAMAQKPSIVATSDRMDILIVWIKLICFIM